MRVRYIGHGIETVRVSARNTPDIQKFTIEQVKEFQPILRFLNAKDRDILYLIFVTNKKQSAVEKILQRGQPSLCYDIRRISDRLKFIVYLYGVFDVFIGFLEDEERRSQYTAQELEVLTMMFYTTSLTQTSKVLKMPQIRVRYRFEKILEKMRELEHWDVYEIFTAIRSNLNIIKRVYDRKKNKPRVKK